MCVSVPTPDAVSFADLPPKVIQTIIPLAGDPHRLRIISQEWNAQVVEYLDTNKKAIEAVDIFCDSGVTIKLRVDNDYIDHFGVGKWPPTGELGPGENVIRIYSPPQSITKGFVLDPLRSIFEELKVTRLKEIFYRSIALVIKFFYLPICILFSVFVISTGNVERIRAMEQEYQNRPRVREERARKRMKRLFASCSRIGVLRLEKLNRRTLDIIRDCLGSAKIGRIEVKAKRDWVEYPRNEAAYLKVIEKDIAEMAQKHGVDSGVKVSQWDQQLGARYSYLLNGKYFTLPCSISANK